jgi:hypothetical protein
VEAVSGNHVDVVEQLLAEEGFNNHVRSVNSHGESVLHLASKACNPAMFRVLMPYSHGLIHQADIQGDTALMQIIKSYADPVGRYESARTLLASPTDAACDSLSINEQHKHCRWQ